MRLMGCRARRVAAAIAAGLWTLSAVGLMLGWSSPVHLEVLVAAATVTIVTAVACMAELIETGMRRGFRLGFDLGLSTGSGGALVPPSMVAEPDAADPAARAHHLHTRARFAIRRSRQLREEALRRRDDEPDEAASDHRFA
jgi:hypothetical protein